jgi:hypothetical protein
MIGRGLESLGTSLEKVGQQLGDIRVNREVAQGITDYNRIINDFNLSLAGKSPDEYMPAFEALKPEIEGIVDGMTMKAGEILKNRFTVLHESNRASTAIQAMKNTALLAKQEIPERLQSFAKEGLGTDAMAYIDGFSDILSEEERALWKRTYQKMEDRNLIFSAIIRAADSPTPENLDEARNLIDELSEDEIDRYYNMNRLRVERAGRTAIKNETYKASMNEQSLAMADSYNSNTAYDRAILPELQPIKSIFDSRLANASLDVSDDLTYKNILEQIETGNYFNPYELVSAYATGMSREEYQNAVKQNEGNKQLTKTQKESLVKFNSYTSDRYNNILSMVRAKIPSNALPEVLAAIDADKASLRKKVLDMVKEGESDADIYKVVEDAFIGDTDRLYKNWFMRWLMPGVYDFRPETREIGDRDERYEIIMEIIKSGRDIDIAKIGKLMEAWYK